MNDNQKAIDRAVDTKEAAEFCGISPRTLENFRLRGGGPEYIRVGGGLRLCRYRISALNVWMDKHTASSTTEEAAR